MRLLWIDWLKSILISLVVVGHSIQFSDVSFESNWLFRFIYSFHMPLFFFVSGFLSFKSTFSIRELPRKLKRLLLPFFHGRFSCCCGVWPHKSFRYLLLELWS